LLIDRDRLAELLNIKESINFLNDITILTSKIELIDKVNIKNYVKILSILFCTPLNYYENNIFSLDLSSGEYNSDMWRIPIKIAYIYKLYQNVDKKIMKQIFNFYNKIIDNLKINEPNCIETKFVHKLSVDQATSTYDININENDYIYEMIDNKIIKEFENKKLLNIPEIAKKFNEKIDNITILDYQNAIIILYEYIYNNTIDSSTINMEYLNELFDSIIINIKSNKIIKNNNKLKRSYNIDFNNISNNNNEESYLNIEDEDEIKYKTKYVNYKNRFNILKKIKVILTTKNFDKSILENYDEINEELIEIIMNKYNNE
jgi:hypothetical protein